MIFNRVAFYMALGMSRLKLSLVTIHDDCWLASCIILCIVWNNDDNRITCNIAISWFDQLRQEENIPKGFRIQAHQIAHRL